MKRKYARFLALAILTVGIAGPALAILGVGDVVFDPTSYAELIKQYLQMGQEYTQLVQTYETILSQYEQMLFMARQDPVNMIARYRALVPPWLHSLATNTYGPPGGWTTGINTGLGAASGYSTATQLLSVYGPALSN